MEQVEIDDQIQRITLGSQDALAEGLLVPVNLVVERVTWTVQVGISVITAMSK